MPNTKASAFPADSTPDDDDLWPYIDIDGGGAGVHQNNVVTTAQLRDAASKKSFIRANANRTLASQTTTQPIFNSPTNGRLTIPTGVYIFEGTLIVTGMSATTGSASLNILGPGTATISSWMWFHHGLDNTTPATVASDQAAFMQTAASPAPLATTGTGTALRVRFKGSFNCTTGGTFVPSILLTTAAAAVVQAGSWVEVERVGAASLVSIGAWD